ncbi:MAG: ankyrin repeat domain-containing protein [Planctomycetes bacterium]|nr:ankyrin repeat domain-containing protein [Planctomycetota bacterium]
MEPSLVKEFVGAGHSDLDKVKAMLAEHPTLLNATWDWGNGDFEMAIGGAGHMGRPDIAEYLISQGGRYDLFVAAMLGELEHVQLILKLHPNLAKSKGPHGISLLQHAKAGGERSKAVLEFVQLQAV